MYTTVEECVERMQAGFWRRYNASVDLQRRLAGKDRVIQLALSDAESYVFLVKDGKLEQVQKGTHERPDIVVSTASRDLLAVFNGELKAMQAYLSGRVRVKAAFSDILFAKSLLGG